jgi:glutamate-5-semialdehyde dehydrogenase
MDTTIDYAAEMTELGRRAKVARRRLSMATTAEKNIALAAIAKAIRAHAPAILEANARDLEEGRHRNLSSALMDRLSLTADRLEGVAKAVEEVINLPDPVGVVDREFTLPNGLAGTRVRVPIGAIGIIYESRPNVTVDAAVLCLKSGNAAILRGGKEAIHSNKALAAAITEGLEASSLPADCVQLVPWTDRGAVNTLLRLNDYVDLIIPRGGEGLIRFVAENATVPVIKHYKGVCHLYVDKAADLEMATSIAINAKCQRPGVCNAIETMLIHQDAAAEAAPVLAKALIAEGVELRGDATFQKLVPEALLADEEDWHEEYLDLILSVKTVSGVQEAIDHINTYGSAHSDAIVSDDPEALEAFLLGVDSAAVYANASTRFTDGGQFGLGAEIGISTDRIHARGPMGLAEMTTYKYVVRGDGEIRS